MTTFAANRAAANDKLANGFPDFPGEQPNKKELEEWFDVWDEKMHSGGFGAFTRNEVPYDIAKLIERPLLVSTDSSLDADVAAKNALIAHQNRAIRFEREGKLIEIKNRLAKLIATSCAPMRGCVYNNCSPDILSRHKTV